MKRAFLGIAVFLLFISADAQFKYQPGCLIIIGGGSIPDTVYTIFERKIGGKDQPIVYIPTATRDEPWIEQGKHLLKFSDRGFTNLQTVHTRKREETGNPAMLDLIKNAKGVFLGGGDQEILADIYGNTAIHSELIALLKRGGVIMGTSAGATIMGSLLIGGAHRKSPHTRTTLKSGFAFMQHTAIDQHVLVRNRQFDLIPVIEQYPDHLGIALDEATAAIVEGDSIGVAGNSYMLIFDPAEWEQQKKEWGRVFKPFTLLGAGQVYKSKMNIWNKTSAIRSDE